MPSGAGAIVGCIDIAGSGAIILASGTAGLYAEDGIDMGRLGADDAAGTGAVDEKLMLPTGAADPPDEAGMDI